MKIAQMALMVWMAEAVAHGGETRQKLTVYLLVRTSDRHMVMPLARELAGRMFGNIGISLEWKTWEPAGQPSQPPIMMPLPFAPGDLDLIYRGLSARRGVTNTPDVAR